MGSERSKLAQAETELGLLGWQQADYDTETQREVEKVQNYEREQSRLTNESADLGRLIRASQETRSVAWKEYETQRGQLGAERTALAEPLEKMEKQLAALRKQEPTYERRIPELDRELREVSRLYTELLSGGQETPQNREDLIRLRERTVAIPNEKADLRTQHLRVSSELKTMETTLKQSRDRIATLDRQIRELEASFGATDKVLGADIRSKEKERARMEKEIDAIERSKGNPYQEIGRVLADNNLAPMNQPNSLEKVRRHRFAMQEFEYEFAVSTEASRQADKTLVHTSYLLWAAMTVALLLIVGALLKG